MNESVCTLFVCIYSSEKVLFFLRLYFFFSWSISIRKYLQLINTSEKLQRVVVVFFWLYSDRVPVVCCYPCRCTTLLWFDLCLFGRMIICGWCSSGSGGDDAMVFTTTMKNNITYSARFSHFVQVDRKEGKRETRCNAMEQLHIVIIIGLDWQ